MGKNYEASSAECKRTLTISNVTHDDAGIYECVCDGDKMSIHILVQGTYNKISYYYLLLNINLLNINIKHLTLNLLILNIIYKV